MLHFHSGSAAVDSVYMDNDRMLGRLDEWFADRKACARIDSVLLSTLTSPDANPTADASLARKRSMAVRSYLAGKYPHLDTECIRLCPACPDGETLSACNAVVCRVYLQPNVSLPFDDPCPRLRLSIPSDDVRPSDPSPADLPGNPLAAPEPDGKSSSKRPLLALKTNMLFDAALMPNVEIEVPIGKRWSVNGEYMFPWWVTKNNRYCLQMLSGGLEARYWLGRSQRREQRQVLTGHFIGLYTGGGEYDLQWKGSGYQGEFFIAAGISYGWATPIGRNLHLELSVGIGVLRTNYRHYHAIDNYRTLLWQENGRYTWLGPTKAKISLVWMLNRKAKKEGVR